MSGADFTRTCAGCEHLTTEDWVKGQICYRCFADGRCRGFMVGIERLNPYIPAWCPKLINEREAAGCKSK